VDEMSSRSSFLGSILFNVASAASIPSRVPARVRSPQPRMASMLGGPEITVLGGGFGGLYTALRLRSLDWSGGPTPRVTLVDKTDRFNFSPMLYELATGTATTWEVAPLYEELLDGTDIDFVRGTVVGLDEVDRIVRVTPPHEADGAGERLLPYDDAMAVRQRLRELQESRGAASDGAGGVTSPPRISVVGGGYIGVELAANIATSQPSDDSAPRVSLIHRGDRLLEDADEHSRVEAEKRLMDAGVDVRLSTQVACVSAGSVRLQPVEAAARAEEPVAGSASDSSIGADGGEATEANAGSKSDAMAEADTDTDADAAVSARTERAAAAARAMAAAMSAEAEYNLPTELTLWATGTQPASVLGHLGIPLDGSGRVDVDATLRVRGRSRLHALGDATAVTDASGKPSPATAQAAMQQADYAAWNVRAALRDGSPTLPFRYVPLGEMLSLGEDAASVSALGQLVKLSGPLAYASRRAVYAARMPTSKQAAKVGLSWAVDAAFGVVRKVLTPPSPAADTGASSSDK
jgi:NADH:ubiquinone reductase (non-electrogenic)